jgi:hypothetical protein
VASALGGRFAQKLPTLFADRSVGAVNDVPLAALAPLVVLCVAIVGYSLYDLSRSSVRHLPKWAWALICVLSIPFGAIVYLLVGREQR